MENGDPETREYETAELKSVTSCHCDEPRRSSKSEAGRRSNLPFTDIRGTAMPGRSLEDEGGPAMTTPVSARFWERQHWDIHCR